METFRLFFDLYFSEHASRAGSSHPQTGPRWAFTIESLGLNFKSTRETNARGSSFEQA